MTRTLSLRAERLTELTTRELAAVAGASGPCVAIQDPNQLLPTYNCTGYYPSINARCTD
jgi:hypothetical protein